MINILKSIIFFIIAIVSVSITSYLYVYKGFIEVPQQTKIIHKEEIKKEIVKEKTYIIEDLLKIQQEKKYHRISDLFLDFLKNESDINYDIHLTLKKDGINQINNFFNSEILINNTSTDIYIKINQTNNNEILFINIYGTINNKEIIIRGNYNKTEKSLILEYLKIDGFLTLFNNSGYEKFLTDDFHIKYSSIIGKKIDLSMFYNFIDNKIPESKKNDIMGLINGIEDFVKLDNSKDSFKFIFSDSFKKTSYKIKRYILINKDLSIGQKQNLIVNLLKLTKKIDNTQISLNKNRFIFENKDSKFLFDYKLVINKGLNPLNYKKLLKEDNKIYSIDGIFNILLKHNKILVKYLNGEDFLFLLRTHIRNDK